MIGTRIVAQACICENIQHVERPLSLEHSGNRVALRQNEEPDVAICQRAIYVFIYQKSTGEWSLTLKNQTFLAVQLFGPGLPPVEWLFKRIRDAGFDGVEILLTNHVIKNLTHITDTALLAGLDTSFHRWWPTGGDVDGWHNKRVTPYLFPAGDARIWEVLPSDFPHDVVVSSYDGESRDEYLHLEHGLYQPTPTGPFFVPFERIKAWMRREATCTVFDIGHWLQCMYWPDTPLASGRNAHELLNTAIEEFEAWKDQIAEVHVYGIERFDATGMNRWPWYSPALNVAAFIKHVQESGWQGRIVWEIHPLQFLRPGGMKKLDRLLKYHT